MRTYELARKYGVDVQGAVTWAFEFEDQPAFAGFRSLATDGIDKPVSERVQDVWEAGGRETGRGMGGDGEQRGLAVGAGGDRRALPVLRT